MLEFKCPKCGGAASSRWALPNPLLVNWLLNPALVINELVLGQRLPKELYFCETCTEPKVQRSYVGCPHCGTWHSGLLWSKGRAFGHWLGYVCPTCGKDIPCLWNVFSLIIVGLTAPLWWIPVRLHREQWRSWQQQRFAEANPSAAQEAIQRVKWIRLGILGWGLPTGVLHSLVVSFFRPGTYWENVGRSMLFFPVWIVGGLSFGFAMKWLMTRWGAPDR